MVFRLQVSVHDKPQTLQHSTNNDKTVTCCFSCNCNRFSLWEMQRQMLLFVSGLNIEENRQNTVSEIYAQST